VQSVVERCWQNFDHGYYVSDWAGCCMPRAERRRGTRHARAAERRRDFQIPPCSRAARQCGLQRCGSCRRFPARRLPAESAIGRSHLPSADRAIGAPFAAWQRCSRCATRCLRIDVAAVTVRQWCRGERGTPVPLSGGGISISRQVLMRHDNSRLQKCRSCWRFRVCAFRRRLRSGDRSYLQPIGRSAFPSRRGSRA